MEYSEQLELLSEDLKQILILLDMFIADHDFSVIEKSIENMESSNSTLQAFPFPETMQKAEIRIAQTKTYKAFYELLKARKAQMEAQRKPETTPGNEILKAMGIS